jgi:hypothetical protein
LFKRLRRPSLAYYYVGVWLVVLGALLATSERWATSRGWLLFAVLLASYRMFDVVRWWAGLFLYRPHYGMMSSERGLVFAVLNLVEVTLVGAIWLRAAGATPTGGDSLFTSFGLVTQLNFPNPSGHWAKVAVALTEIAALTVLLGGVVSLLSEVQEKFRTAGEWQGRSKRKP